MLVSLIEKNPEASRKAASSESWAQSGKSFKYERANAQVREIKVYPEMNCSKNCGRAKVLERISLMVPGAGIEPARLAAGDFESPASTNFTTRAGSWCSRDYAQNRSIRPIPEVKWRMNPFVYLIPLLDLAGLMLASVLAFHGLLSSGSSNPADYQFLTLMLLSIAILFFWATQSYHGFYRGQWRQSVQRAWLGWCIVFAVALVALFALKTSQRFSRLWLFTWWGSGLAIIAFNRVLGYALSSRAYRRGLWLKKILLIGLADSALRFADKQKELLKHGYRIEVTETIEADQQFSDGRLAELVEASHRHDFAEVWMCFPLAHEREIQQVASAMALSALPVRVFPDLSHLDLINMTAGKLGSLPYLSLASSNLSAMSLALKWAEDMSISLVALILLAPLMLLIAVGIKATSPGPVFYRQTRIGLNGQAFQMLKFRSMVVGFEQQQTVWGNAVKKPVTRFGALLRKTSLDELPQLLNVLKGDMSLVGPRPERPMFVEQFKHEIPLYMKKHLVKAGITGWAQIHGYRGDTDLEKRIQYDLYYIRNWTLLLDFKIMFLTAFALVSKEA